MKNLKKVLEVKNITKIYKTYKSNFDRLKEIFVSQKYHHEFISNENISFDLYEGETLGIIGVNGAGKSTILKMIAGVTTPTSGQIIKHGKVTALLELGSGFNNEMTGYENIDLNASLIGMTKADIKKNLKNIINFSELDAYINEPIKSYSSGMKMRLAFSIAIYSQPKILIVDEALSVGDAHFSAKCTQALTERKKNNMSIIYVSHDLNSLKLLSDRIILLNQGKLIEEGDPESVVNKYNFLIAKLNDAKNIIKTDLNNSKSFGTFDVKIQSIEMKKNAQSSTEFTTGDKVSIEIIISSKIETEDLTIGISIKDKYAQDIYGTNTYYQDKKLSLQEGHSYLCTYELDLNIGVGKYTLAVALHTADWHTELCYHWIDNGVNFNVSATKEKQFIGLCKLDPHINFKELNE